MARVGIVMVSVAVVVLTWGRTRISAKLMLQKHAP